MSRLVRVVTVCALALAAAPLTADEVKPAVAKKPDQVERVLAALAADAQLKDNFNVAEVPLGELLQLLSKQHQLTIVVNERSFKEVGRPNIKEERPELSATQLRDVTVHRLLTQVLDSLGGTYLVKNGVIEVVTVEHAAKACKAALDGLGEESGRPRLKEPLVSAVITEKPLNEALAKLAETFDLTVVMSPQAGDARTGFVSARLLNVPADKALELLALQCDLRVVRKAGAFLVTSKDQANELFHEKLDRERQKVELEKLREAPAAPPKPPAPEPKP